MNNAPVDNNAESKTAGEIQAVDGRSEASPSIKKVSTINIRKDILVPMFLTVFAGLIAVFAGLTWEYVKFKRQTVFEKRITFIAESRKRIMDIYIDADTIVRSVEYVMNTRKNGTCTVGDISQESDALYALGVKVRLLPRFTKRIIESESIQKDVDLHLQSLKLYLDCIESPTCKQCRRSKYDILTPIQSILDTHTDQLYLQIDKTGWKLSDLMQ